MAAATLLDETLDAWRYAREGVIAEFENIPAESYGFRPAPGSRSVIELAQHIVESGRMMSGELSRTDGNFQRQPYPEFMKEYGAGVDRVTDKPGLIALLARSYEDGAAAIGRAGELLMLQQIVQFNGEPATRLSWMNHGISHEEYHRGQAALYARLLGIVPALTKAIYGA
jgi:uncharacterized damage-inducible protein DinB